MVLRSVCCVSSAGLYWGGHPKCIPEHGLSQERQPQAVCMQSAHLGAAGAALETGHRNHQVSPDRAALVQDTAGPAPSLEW